MKIIFPDIKTIGEDLDLSPFDAFGEVIKYPFSTPEELRERSRDADIIIFNKVRIDEASVGDAKHLKIVCVTGTGTNNIDKDYLASKGIAWRNVAGYSTESVAQHTFAMLFYLIEKLSFYDDYVKGDHYTNDTSFGHFREQFHEISGKTWGIIGLGSIGRRVADIAKVFGANVIYASPSGQPPQDGYHQTDLDTLLRSSDIISVHAPLNEYTENLLDEEAFDKMKANCIFLNLGRGAIVVEEALAHAIKNGSIAAAGLDVLAIEPMSDSSPFREFKDSKRLLITPHVAWASVESRTRLMNIILSQLKGFFQK